MGKYVRQAEAQNRPNAPTGSDGPSEAEHPPPIEATDCRASSGPVSECEPFREEIEAKLEQGLSATRIHQDLREEPGFAASYYSVRRFVARLKRRRRRCRFVGWRRRRVKRLRSISAPGRRCARRKARRGVRGSFASCFPTRERPTARRSGGRRRESFIQCLENAFRHFGGVPKRLVIDNLKAAVAKADWYDPEVHPKLQSFAAHYGTVFLPTKPYTPRHKGKVESGVKYVKGNALKGREFTSLAEENQFLLDWETQVADTRIHGTTKRQVSRLFEEHEREALSPLPRDRFPFFHEGRRTVHRDGHVEVDKAYYSRAAGVSGASAVGSLGRPPGPAVQRALGAVGDPRQARAGPVPHGRRSTSRRRRSRQWSEAPTPCSASWRRSGPKRASGPRP